MPSATVRSVLPARTANSRATAVRPSPRQNVPVGGRTRLSVQSTSSSSSSSSAAAAVSGRTRQSGAPVIETRKQSEPPRQIAKPKPVSIQPKRQSFSVISLLSLAVTSRFFNTRHWSFISVPLLATSHINN